MAGAPSDIPDLSGVGEAFARAIAGASGSMSPLQGAGAPLEALRPGAGEVSGAERAVTVALKSLAGVLPVVGGAVRQAVGTFEQVMAPFRAATEKHRIAVEAARAADEAHAKALQAVKRATEDYDLALAEVEKAQTSAAAAEREALAAVTRATDDHAAAAKAAAKAVEEAAQAEEAARKSGKPEDAEHARNKRTLADDAEKQAATKQQRVQAAEKTVERVQSSGKEEVAKATRAAERKQEDQQAARVTMRKTEAAAQAKHAAAEKAAPGGLGNIASFVGGLATAIGGAVSAITGIVDAVKGFVEALSPSTIMVFQQALRDLQATVGVAFEPIFEILSGTIRQVAGIILPVMEELRPVVAQITEAFAGALGPQVQFLATLLSALMPVIQVLADVFGMLQAAMQPVYAVLTILAQAFGFWMQLLAVALTPVTEAMRVVSAVFEGVGETLRVLSVVLKAAVDSVMVFAKALFGASFKDTIASVQSAFQKLIANILIFIATLARVFGFDDFLKRLIEGLKPRHGAKAAAQNPAQKSFEQIANDMALAASVAAGRAGGEKEPARLDDLLRQLEDIRAGKGNSKFEEMKRALDEINYALRHPWEFVRDVLGGEARRGAVRAVDAVDRVAGRRATDAAAEGLGGPVWGALVRMLRRGGGG